MYLDTLFLREFVSGDRDIEFEGNIAIFRLRYYIVFHKLCFRDEQSMLSLLLQRRCSMEGRLEWVLEAERQVVSGGNF